MRARGERMGARERALTENERRVRPDRTSRRTIVARAAAGAAAASFWPVRPRAAAAVTPQEIVDRVKKAVGVAWRPETVDTFKAGDPGTVVAGIATTSLPTMAVLRRVVDAGANLVITSGPTFYSKADSATPPAGRGTGPVPDKVRAAKADFIRTHNLVVWRFSDHWRLRTPNPFAEGLTEILGWPQPVSTDGPARVSIPGMTLDALAAHMKGRLQAAGGIRVIGDPQLNVRNVGLLPGSSAIQASLGLLPAVDVIVAGEVREWEAVEYVRDTVTAGRRKGLVLLGRILSEDPGMRLCAGWLKGIVPEVAATWIPAGDPYWRPA
jgi:hypothetical protein